MGFRWASFTIGMVALVLSSIPFILFKYGSIIRNKSKFAGTVAAKEQILESDDDSEKVKV